MTSLAHQLTRSNVLQTLGSHEWSLRRSRERSHLTFMIYINDGYEGGETAFDEFEVKPESGMALWFVHQLRHKGNPVTAGRKYALRSDVMYRTPG
jgi:prolyl 4-hydroxylase